MFIRRFFSITFWLGFLFALLYSLLIIYFVADADQYLYQKMVAITLDTNIIYKDIYDSHQLNSLYLFNALQIDLFGTNVTTYTYGIYRIVEGFIYVFLAFLLNDCAFKSRKLTGIMLGCGAMGLGYFSIGAFNGFAKLTALFGNSGTYMLVAGLPFIYALNLYVKRPNNLYILSLIFLTPFVFTTTLYPLAPYFMLIYYYIFRNEKNILIILIPYFYNIGFYLVLNGLPYFLILPIIFVILMRLFWLIEYKKELVKLYHYALLFHMIGFALISGVYVGLSPTKVLLVLALILYYHYNGATNTFKYCLLVAYVYLIYYGNHENSSIVIMARRIIIYLSPVMLYDLYLRRPRFVYIAISCTLLISSYQYFNQPSPYAPRAQIDKHEGLSIKPYHLENKYETTFAPGDKIYQETFDPRIFTLGEFIFSVNEKQCNLEDETCVCEPEDQCYLVVEKYRKTDSYNYLFNNYEDPIVSESYKELIIKTNDEEQIEYFIDSQLR